MAKAGFQRVANVPLQDLTLIPSEAAAAVLNLMRDASAVPDVKLYVHCTAGQNRSPTVVWLYLVACGMPPGEAKRLIVARSPDAIPGNASLVDDELIEAARQHGRARGFVTVGPLCRRGDSRLMLWSNDAATRGRLTNAPILFENGACWHTSSNARVSRSATGGFKAIGKRDLLAGAKGDR